MKFLNEMSVPPVAPVFVTFIFVVIQQGVSVHVSFRFETLHSLFLAVNCLLKESIRNMLDNKTRGTSETKTRSGSD